MIMIFTSVNINKMPSNTHFFLETGRGSKHNP